MTRNLLLPMLGASVLAMTGCMSMNGLSDSSGKFACKAPDGVSCTSVSGVYANAQQDNLPALQAYRKVPLTAVSPSSPIAAIPVPLPGMPIRSQPRTLRIWVAPWVDEEGDLHDQSFMYVVVDPGKWLVEHTREATVRKTLTRLRPLGQPNLAASSQSSDQSQAVEQTPQQAAQQAAVVPAPQEVGQ